MAIGKVQKLWEGNTEEDTLHIEFSLAQDVEVEVTGGELLSAEIYGRAADLELSSGYKSITVTGVPLRESSVVLNYPVHYKGETDAEENLLVTNDELADAIAERTIRYLTMRNTYDVHYRGNPELETGDVIGFRTMFTDDVDAMVLADEIAFNGAIRGNAKVKWLDDSGVTMPTAHVPAQKEPIVYDGKPHLPEWAEYNSGKVDMTVTSQTNAGTYYIQVTPKEGYSWRGTGTTETRTTEWTIGKKDPELTVKGVSESILMPIGATLTYDISRIGNGTIQAVSSDTSAVTATVSGQTVTIRAVTAGGSATVTVTSSETANYAAGTVVIYVSVESMPIAVEPPYQAYELMYNGERQEPEWTGYDENAITIQQTPVTGPGSYETIFQLNEGYVWADSDTSGYKRAIWHISKGNGNDWTVSPWRQLAIPVGGSITLDITMAEGVTFTAYSSDVNKVRVAGTTASSINLIGTGAGTANVTITTEENDYYTSKTWQLYVVIVKQGTIKQGILTIYPSSVSVRVGDTATIFLTYTSTVWNAGISGGDMRNLYIVDSIGPNDEFVARALRPGRQTVRFMLYNPVTYDIQDEKTALITVTS